MIEVRNLVGSLIYKGSSSTIDISKQPKGVYLFYVTAGNVNSTHKVLKK